MFSLIRSLFFLLLILVAGVFLVPAINASVAGMFWFLFKVSTIIYMLIWFRGTFPRFRYDQLMNFGWRWMIPLALANIIVTAIVCYLVRGSSPPAPLAWLGRW